SLHDALPISLFAEPLKYYIQGSSLLGNNQDFLSPRSKIRHQITDELGFACPRRPLYHAGLARSYGFHYFFLAGIDRESVEQILVTAADNRFIHGKFL